MPLVEEHELLTDAQHAQLRFALPTQPGLAHRKQPGTFGRIVRFASHVIPWLSFIHTDGDEQAAWQR
jgi:hypothetical protein